MEVEYQKRRNSENQGAWMAITDNIERYVMVDGVQSRLSSVKMYDIAKGSSFLNNWEYRRVPKDPLVRAIYEASR